MYIHYIPLKRNVTDVTPNDTFRLPLNLTGIGFGTPFKNVVFVNADGPNNLLRIHVIN